MQLTNGNGKFDGVLEILYQGEWYTTCRPSDYNYYYNYYYYYYPYNNHGDVVCKELGYDGGVVAFYSRRPITYQYIYPLWDYSLYCEGTEDSIYDCFNRYGEFYYSSCYAAEYSCQSMYAY